MNSLLQDIRFGWRLLMKDRGFTAVAALTLALGIGASTAVFSVVNAVVLRPLTFRDPDRLMAILSASKTADRPFSSAPGVYFDWRAKSQSFERIVGAYPMRLVMSGAGEPRYVNAAAASHDFLEVLGFQPIAGRMIAAEEDAAGRPGAALLAAEFWELEFARDPSVLGRTLTLHDKPYQIVGIAPPGIRFADFGARDIWISLAADPRARTGGPVVAGAYLLPGVSRAAAQAEMDLVMRGIAAEHRGDSKTEVRVLPLREWLTGSIRRSFFMVLGAAGFLLLIACSNIASLMLARATARSREMAVRASLGAGRWRLARQQLTESLLLAAIGGAIGAALAYVLVKLAPALRSLRLPRMEEIAVDRDFLLAAVALSMISGVLFGLAPAWQSARADLQPRMRAGAAAGRMRNALAAVQLALAMVLLSGAGLMTNTLVRLLNVDLGFSPSRTYIVAPSLSYTTYDQPRRVQLLRTLAAEIRSMPGVESAAAANNAPLHDVHFDSRLVAGDRTATALTRFVDTGYFRTLGTPLLAGRDFESADDTSTPVPVVLNRIAAQALFGTEDPIGRTMVNRDGRMSSMQVIGVVGDVRLLGVVQAAGPQIYIPLWRGYSATMVVVRGVLNAPEIRAAFRRLAPAAAAPEITALETVFADQIAQPRTYAALLDGFAILGLLLAAVGIYGVMAYSVARRRHEFGIRLALGATPWNIVRLVLGSGGRIVAIGAGLGLAGAAAATRLLSSLLYGVEPGDPATLAFMLSLLAAVGLTACYLAARRAPAVDLSSALRNE